MCRPLISVIVPVYNVEPYLEKCVSSITGQTYRNLEIILVDDGSVDRGGQMCDKFAAQDGRIVVIHQQNRGLSAARNAALDVAHGEFIGFVDSDDWIEPDMYERLYEALSRAGADIAACGWQVHENDKTRFFRPDEQVLPPFDAIKLLITDPGKIGMCVWNKLYKTHLFSQLRFPVNRNYEDECVMPVLLDSACKTVIFKAAEYHYVRRVGSITKSPYSSKSLDAVFAAHTAADYITGKYPRLTPLAEELLHKAYFGVLDKMVLAKGGVDAAEKKRIIDALRQNTAKILSGKFTWKRKVAALALCVHESAYKLLVLAQQIRG